MKGDMPSLHRLVPGQPYTGDHSERVRLTELRVDSLGDEVLYAPAKNVVSWKRTVAIWLLVGCVIVAVAVPVGIFVAQNSERMSIDDSNSPAIDGHGDVANAVHWSGDWFNTFDEKTYECFHQYDVETDGEAQTSNFTIWSTSTKYWVYCVHQNIAWYTHHGEFDEQRISILPL